MKATTITEDEIKSLKVASLPTRPTSPKSFGGNGYTATQMKEAFDRLPMFIIDRLNALLGDILDTGADSVAAAIPTGIRDGHKLATLFSDISSGNILKYIMLGEASLFRHLIALREDVNNLLAHLGLEPTEV